jgi:S-disulfanyl-L-cysteine oxidoreductase SoxD
MPSRPMRPPGWRITIAACLVAAPGCHAWAQQAATDSTRSTLSGVYTAEQAARGQEIYVVACRQCHPPATHSGPAFTGAWAGRRLWDLFEYVQESMPKSDPGSLSPGEYARVLAYLLSMNGMPVGKDELPTDAKALKTIRFDTTHSRGATPWRDG